MTFAPCYSQSPPPPDFTSPCGFLALESSTQTAERRWGLGFVYNISLFTFESSIFLPIETKIRDTLKGRKPGRKPYHPYGWFQKAIQDNQSMKKSQVCS
jgi:hypothetical protein